MNTNNTVFEIVPATDHDHGTCTNQGLFGLGHSAFFVGGGKENYAFPTTAELVTRALAHTDSPDFVLAVVPKTKRGYRINLGVLSQLDPNTFQIPMPRVIHFVKADAPTAKVSTERLLAHDMANVMIEGMFSQPVYAFFSEDYRTLGHDKGLLAPEYHEIADSLYAQLKSAEQQVVAALPQVMSELQKRYPEASTGQLYQGALQLIGNELSPILSTVQMWTTGFRQSLDPKIKDTLVLVRAMIESNLFLSLTGNLKLDHIEKGDIHQVIPTINVSVGDVVLPLLVGAFDSGPAVIPMHDGALGPRGGHLAFVPWNLTEVLPLINSIYMHETGHLLQHVIVDFMETYTKLIASTIAAGVQSKTLVFDEQFIMLGSQKVPADKFWTMVFMGQLGELDADNWGMRTSGPGAFAKCFINYVGAMTEVAVGNMDKVDHVLRMGSSYKVVQSQDGKVSIALEPHPQDGPRIGSWQAAVASLMGYPADSKYARDYAASESGKDAKRITWVGEMPEGAKGEDEGDTSFWSLKRVRSLIAAALKKLGAKSDDDKQGAGPKQPKLPTISASLADYDKVAKVVAAAFFDTKTACLNGLSLKELVCLTPQMQKEKVDPIKELLKKGESKLPNDGRHYFFHTVGSASVLALYELVEEGVDAKVARERVVAAAMSMMNELLPKWLADVKRLDIYKLTEAQVQPTSSK